ncbi:hypothetical protein GBA52_017640 [Prunus armeniaca]|nr:hypothetical protein GBA52_017640 [Prunus armeniaca]
MKRPDKSIHGIFRARLAYEHPHPCSRHKTLQNSENRWGGVSCEVRVGWVAAF